LKDFKKNQHLPVARKNDIVVQELSGETLVYDLRQHKAHCLNQTAAIVWSHCDGETDVASIASTLSNELHRAIDEDVVWLALKQLQKVGLLEREAVAAGAKSNVSRREVIRRLGTATALALPLVTSVVAPTSAAVASVPVTCQCCTVGIGNNAGCPTECLPIQGDCFNNNSCMGIGGDLGQQTCAQCQALPGAPNSWRALGFNGAQCP
jgi:hypothetical protein